MSCIEGRGGAVCENTYDLAEGSVLGYGRLPENMAAQSFAESAGGVSVSVEADEGAFPIGTTMTVREVGEADILDSVSDVVDGEIVRVKAVDITFYDRYGYEIEPAIPIRVTMSAAAVEEAAPVVVHVDGEGEAEIIAHDEAASEAEEIVFDAEAFSVYAIVYTVDFDYDGNKHTIAGESEILLSVLFDKLGISADVTGSAVTFSDPSLISLSAVTDETGATVDWLIKSLKAFHTEETLTILLSDGTELVILVTDDSAVNVLNPSVSIKLVDGAEKVGDDWVWEADTYHKGHAFTYRVNYAFSSDTVSKTQWEVRQIELRLPASILTDRDENAADEFLLSVPRYDQIADGNTTNVFVYRIEGDEIVIYNRLPAAPTQVGYFEISYVTTEETFYYSDYQSEGKGETSAAPSVTLTVYGEKLDEDNNPVVDIDNTLITPLKETDSPVHIDTTAKVTSTDKQNPVATTTGWDSTWGTEPRDMEETSAAADDADESADAPNYIYILWTVKTKLEANQPFTFTLEDVFTPAYGEVVGYRMPGNSLYTTEDSDYYNHSGYFIPASVEGCNRIYYETLPNGAVTRTDYVLTRIEKEYYDDLLKEQDSYIVNNTVRAVVTPADGVDGTTYASDTEPYTGRRSEYKIPVAGFTSDKKGLTTSYDLTEFALNSTDENYLDKINGLEYRAWLDGSAYRYTYQFTADETNTEDPGVDSEDGRVYFGNKKITYEITDNTLELRYFDYNSYKVATGKTEIDESSVDEYTKTEPLTEEDYYIASIAFSYQFRAANYNSSTKAFSGTALSDSAIADYAADKKIGDLVFTIENNGTSVNGEIYFNLSTKQFSVSQSDGADDDVANYIDLTASNEAGKVIFKTDEGINITGYTMKNDNALYSTRLETYPSVTLKHSDTVDAIVKAINVDGNPELQMELWNTANYKAYQGDAIFYLSDRADEDLIIGDTRVSELEKTYASRVNDTINGRYVITWAVTMDEIYTVSGEELYVRQSSGTFYDLLPLGVEYIAGSTVVTADGETLVEGQYSVSIDSNYNGTGRALLTIQVDEPADVYTLNYDTAMEWDTIIEQRTGESTLIYAHNAISYVTGNDEIGYFAADSYNGSDVNDDADDTNDDSSKFNSTDRSSLGNLYSDTDTEKRVISTIYDCPVSALVSGTLELQKSVRASDSALSYGKSAVTYTEGEYSYKLQFGVDEDTKATGLIIYDFLETATEHGNESEWQGTLKSVDTTMASAAGAAPVVYYATETAANTIKANIQDITTEYYEVTDSDKGWVLATEYTGDLSDVKAIAIDLRQSQEKDENGDPIDFILQPGQIISATVYMTAPDSAVVDKKTGEINPYAKTYNDVYLRQVLANKDDAAFNDNMVKINTEGHTVVTFRVKGELTLYKVDSGSEAPIKGITFRLRGTSAYGTAYDLTIASGTNGRVVFPNIEMNATGEYYTLQEVGGVSDYLVDDTVYQVQIDESGNAVILGTEGGGTTRTAIVTVYGTDTTVASPTVDTSEETDHTDTYQITNDPRTHGDLEFTKAGKTDGSTAVKTLEGATFLLTGVSYYGNTVELYATSDENGVVRFEDIEQGTYTVSEVGAAEGYILANRTFTVTVDANGNASMALNGDAADTDNVTFTVTTSGSGEYKDETYTVTDEPLHSFGLYKQDSVNASTLAGAQFRLIGTSDYGTVVDQTVTTTEDGRATFTDVEAGTYAMTEIDAPENHVVDGINYTVVVESDGKVTIYWTEDGETKSMTNEIDGTVVTVDGQGEDSTADQLRFAERFFYTYQGRFNIPNDRSEEGRILIIKQWLNKNVPITDDTSGFPIPVVNVDSEVPVQPKSPAVINRNDTSNGQTSWNSFTSKSSLSSITYFGQYTGTDAIDDTWTDISDKNYDGKVYVKVIGTSLYWRMGENTSTVYLPSGTHSSKLDVGCSGFFNNTSFKNSIQTIDLSGLKADIVTDMYAMFSGCTNLKQVTFPSDFNTANVTTFANCFNGCNSLKKIDNLSSFDTKKATHFFGMFKLCNSLNPIDVSNFDFSSGTDFTEMFQDCNAVQVLDLSSFQPSAEITIHSMFCRSGTESATGKIIIYASCDWDSYAKSSTTVFKQATKVVGGSGTTFSNTSQVYARIDGGTEKPGYFTYKAYTAPNTDEPVNASSIGSAAANAAAATTAVRKTTTSVLVTGETGWTDSTWAYTGELTDQWVYNETNKQWYYVMTVYKDDTTFYVTEDQVDSDGNAYLSPFTWISQDTDKWYQELDYEVDGTNNTVTVKNNRTTTTSTGSLLVTKLVNGEVDPDEEFTFTVITSKGTETITLKAGESRTFTGLTSGSAYTVKETLDSSYDVPTVDGTAATVESTAEGNTVYIVATGNIMASSQARVTVTNTAVSTTGDLEISKTVEAANEDIELDPDASFTFTVQLWTEDDDGEGGTVKTAVTGAYGSSEGALVFTSETVEEGTVGTATLSLKGGEAFTLKDMPAGVKYAVTEAAAENYTTTKTGDTGTIPAGDSQTAAFTNTKTQNEPVGALRLIKALGADTETEEAFGFVIRFTGLQANKSYTYTVTDTSAAGDEEEEEEGEESEASGVTTAYTMTAAADGSCTLTLYLTAAQYADFTKLPEGAGYTVTELASGYIASYTVTGKTVAQSGGGNTGANASLSTAKETVEDGEEAIVTFTNTEPLHTVKLAKKNASTLAGLAGAALELKKLTVDNTETDEESGLITEIVTVGSLVAAVTSKTSGNEISLRHGSYLITETAAPQGYTLAKSIRFDVDMDGTITYWSVTVDGSTLTEIDGTRQSGSGIDVEMLDPPVEVTVRKIEQYGENEYLLSGAWLQVLEGEDVVYQWSTTGAPHTITDVLELDTVYTLHEAQAPSGYAKAEDIYFKLAEVEGAIVLYTSADAENWTIQTGDTLTVTMVDETEFIFYK